ncbi:carbohydrate porin [Flammeovirga yaeyamensis]|uniref:Carbohydrate porin n=1 Tax=Flammeovirga yaeyamensis TaxID=367791 RepID=A0AAX1N850_9BACT|nr:hypothetical protein [Flammeovirga yaeyamensis]MBB3700547.1 hypothetical protein [Flammeovirga yaeyamensis]NMF37664.1 carbohydrate porin [Flammeovirga yaeyamensis]QWG01973.1 carbohydrate porin [Flammeovirga yaeyamensis]
MKFNILITLFFLLVIQSVFAQKAERKELYKLDSAKYSDDNFPPGRFQILSGQFYPNWEPHLGKGLLPLPKYYQWKQKLSSKGIDYLLVFSPEYQLGTKGGALHGNSEQDVIISWRVAENENSYSKFLFWGLNVYRFTGTTPSELSAEQGLTVGTIGGADAKSFWMLGTFFFEQGLLKHKLKLRVGHLFTNMLYATNKYMADDRDTFINGILNSPEGVQWTSQKSLGFNFQYDFGKFYVMGGFQDQKSDPRYPNFNSFLDGDYVYLGEVGYTPNRGTNHEGFYSLTMNYNTAYDNVSSGYGLLFNFHQDINSVIGVYGKYGQSFERFGYFKRAYAAGLAVNGPFGWDYDQISIAYLNGDPSDPTLNNSDQGINMYYKWLLTYRTDFTVDAQYYFDRSKALPTDRDNAFLIGMRLRTIF